MLAQKHSTFFETKPAYPLKLSLYQLAQDGSKEIIKKVRKNYRFGVKPKLQSAENISGDYLNTETETEIYINLQEVKRNFIISGINLFDFVMQYDFPREVLFEEKVTIYCQLISLYEEEFDLSENFNRQNEIEFAIVYPAKNKIK